MITQQNVPPQQSDNGQGQAIGPQAVIDALMQRVQQLTMENVMLQAALNQKEHDESHNQSAMGSQEAQGDHQAAK